MRNGTTRKWSQPRQKTPSKRVASRGNVEGQRRGATLRGTVTGPDAPISSQRSPSVRTEAGDREETVRPGWQRMSQRHHRLPGPSTLHPIPELPGSFKQIPWTVRAGVADGSAPHRSQAVKLAPHSSFFWEPMARVLVYALIARQAHRNGAALPHVGGQTVPTHRTQQLRSLHA